jgi:hypothetical protein
MLGNVSDYFHWSTSIRPINRLLGGLILLWATFPDSLTQLPYFRFEQDCGNPANPGLSLMIQDQEVEENGCVPEGDNMAEPIEGCPLDCHKYEYLINGAFYKHINHYNYYDQDGGRGWAVWQLDTKRMDVAWTIFFTDYGSYNAEIIMDAEANQIGVAED